MKLTSEKTTNVAALVERDIQSSIKLRAYETARKGDYRVKTNSVFDDFLGFLNRLNKPFNDAVRAELAVAIENIDDAYSRDMDKLHVLQHEGKIGNAEFLARTVSLDAQRKQAHSVERALANKQRLSHKAAFDSFLTENAKETIDVDAHSFLARKLQMRYGVTSISSKDVKKCLEIFRSAFVEQMPETFTLTANAPAEIN